MLEVRPGLPGREFVPITIARLRAILDRITTVRVLVLGDYCLDIYWFIDSARSEKSIETGLMTNPVREQHYSLGGAANVVNNVIAAGCRNVRALGVVGDDPSGREMIRLLQATGADTEGMLIQREDWATLAYNKPYFENQEGNRFDFGNFNALSPKTARELLERCRARVPDADVVIVNQQVRQGIHTAELREGLVALIGAFPEKVFVVDSRHHSEAYSGAWMKINDHEAARLCGTQRAAGEPILREDALAAARQLYARFAKPVFVTRGRLGLVAVDHLGLCEIPGIRVPGRVDTVGAGDSALAGIALALGAGCDTVEAAQLGNFVAGVTIQKLNQTGTASPEEILAIGGKQA